MLLFAARDRVSVLDRHRRLGFIDVGQVTLFAGCALFTALLVGGSGYAIREFHRQVSVASSLSGLAIPVAEPSPSIVITPEMLHVSSIALGHLPVAVVNGATITEGASFELQTAEGSVTLRVIVIKDGVVQFKCGGQTISANLRQTFPQKLTPK